MIGSGLLLDRCGVCNGDSTKCTPVMETYTKDWREKGKKILHVKRDWLHDYII